MKKDYKGLLIIFTICSLTSLWLSSCVSPKSITYINNLPENNLIELDSLKVPQPVILVNDVLEIKIGGENEKTVQYINQYIGGSTASAANTGGSGQQFIVDINGNIDLPKIGKVKLTGLTKDEAKDTLTALFKQILIDPIVSIKFNNFRFSVIGEVKSPGTYMAPGDKVSIFEALAQAGDITNFGRFENVHIIRDINGKRKIIKIDLTNKNILNSEDYYISRYDVIYVQARALKSVTENVSRTSTFIATVASILAIILVLKK
jgi:polysaccharide export outer membrane protein